MSLVCRKVMEHGTCCTDLRRLRPHPAMEMGHWERGWASAEGDSGIVTNYLHHEGSRYCLKQPRGGQNSRRLKHVAFPKISEKPHLEKMLKQQELVFLGPGQPVSPAAVSPALRPRVTRLSLQLPVQSSLLSCVRRHFPVKSYHHHFVDSSRATNANMLCMVRVGPRHSSPPRGRRIQETRKGLAARFFLQLPRWRRKHSGGLRITHSCLPTWSLKERNKCYTLTYIQKYSPFMRRKKKLSK